jgi:hypothetical protein
VVARRERITGPEPLAEAIVDCDVHLVAADAPVATQARALLIDMRSLEARWESVERDPACPVCRSLFER